jgi:hypothetical protein
VCLVYRFKEFLPSCVHKQFKIQKFSQSFDVDFFKRGLADFSKRSSTKMEGKNGEMKERGERVRVRVGEETHLTGKRGPKHRCKVFLTFEASNPIQPPEATSKFKYEDFNRCYFLRKFKCN